MREYQLPHDDNQKYNAYCIGINHHVNGIMIGGVISSYNKEFDCDDEICIESGVDDIRHCKVGDIRETYRLLRGEIASKQPSTLVGYSDCVLNVIVKYFGNFVAIKKRSSYFPTDEDVLNGKEMGKVSDLAYKNAASGIERAIVSHNLFCEIGIKSTFKISEALINGKVRSHAYNLVCHDNKYYIFDAAMPTFTDGKIDPIVCELPEEVYNLISNPNSNIGISIIVHHFNPLESKEYDVIYDAGREDVYEVEKAYVKKKVK